jgi:hypothetical protein
MHRRRGDRHGAIVAALTLLLAMMTLAAPAAAKPTFKPRIGFAMGLEPVHGSQEVASGANIPVVYHGGSVMRNVTVHVVFWAPPGYRFNGAPGAGIPGYQPLIQQFFSDAAHDSGTGSNIFSLLNQFGDHAGNGSYQLQFDPAVDSVVDTHPYPSGASQCASPSGTATCVTDLQLQHEIDRLIGPGNPGARGLSNIWFVLLPPDVDECISSGVCGTSAFAGYHSAFELGHGLTVYAAIPDPTIELTPPAGSDPQGNPEAEATIDTMAHEAIEAITDPVGTAWMDPNGFENADKCENGPQQGPALGFAANGSPYNQLINGHQYLIQDVWSNSRNGCVQSSATVASIPVLHTVNMRQFSSAVSGNIGAARRVPVVVVLARANTPVAIGAGASRADGSWGPFILRGRGGKPHALGDDRDQIQILYGIAKHSPPPDLIQTGSGGNPFTEAGFTGWFDLDHGYSVQSTGRSATTLLIGPCSQTGVLSLRIGATLAPSPTDLCETEADAAVIKVGHIGAGTPMTMTSLDNRGGYALEPNGAIVKLTIGLGEPDSISSLGNSKLIYTPTGFPTCTAFLRIQTVRCSGLVPRARYRILRGGRVFGGGQAGGAGAVTLTGVAVRGGDVLTLVNAAGRRLTSLHVAHLRVAIVGNQTQVASGSCQAGDYWGTAPSTPPTSAGIGAGIGGSGTVCPNSGRAKGLSTADITQTDDFSGGSTETQVPLIQSTSPIQDETLYGPFVASAQSGLPGPHGSVSAAGTPIALTISEATGTHQVVFRSRNVDTGAGVPVSGLAPGSYVATWVLHDASGDTRTVTTRFAEA